MGFDPAPQGMITRYKSRLNYANGTMKCPVCGALIVKEPCQWCERDKKEKGDVCESEILKDI